MSENKLDKETAVAIFKKMALVKLNDDRIVEFLKSGRLQHPFHSPRGQECIPAAISQLLTREDYMVTIYRGLHDTLCKGVPSKLIWAEFAGRSTGACKGKGGPMHVTYPAVGCMVTTGIVGSGLPIACGLGLSAQYNKNGRVTVCNFGDGAVNIGAFHESLNLAAVWKLPVIFVCQNNLYAEHTAFSATSAVPRVADRALAYGIPGVRVDGNDPAAVYFAAQKAIKRARSGDGPTLLEATTFRFNGHLIGEASEYIDKAAYSAAKQADPYDRYRASLVERGLADAAQLEEIEAEIRKEIDEAIEFAFSSPLNDVAEVERDVYAESAVA